MTWLASDWEKRGRHPALEQAVRTSNEVSMDQGWIRCRQSVKGVSETKMVTEAQPGLLGIWRPH